MEELILKIKVSKQTIKRYKGRKNYKMLIQDIIDRYGHEEYFSPNLLKLIYKEY